MTLAFDKIFDLTIFCVKSGVYLSLILFLIFQLRARLSHLGSGHPPLIHIFSSLFYYFFFFFFFSKKKKKKKKYKEENICIRGGVRSAGLRTVVTLF